MSKILNVHWVKTCLFLLLVFSGTTKAQEAGQHEVTLYAFPTLHPFDWKSPAALYKTARHCFYKTISLKDNYLLGHMALSLNSPLLPQKKYLAMTAANKKQRVDLILKDKIGLAILGATLEGKMESEEHILTMLQVYSERKKLAYITFRVSEAAMIRMLDFITAFSRSSPSEVQTSTYYGGYFWPLYENEGAGCSAFALGVLAAADLLPAEASAWMRNVNIPMQLIGGEYRDNKSIPFARILKYKSWYEGDGLPNVDFVNVQTYDPSVLMEWILQRRMLKDSFYIAEELNGVPGLIVNSTQKPLPADKPYFVKRAFPNLFLDIYRKKILKNATQPTP